MQRAIRRSIVKEYAKEAGICRINRRLRGLFESFMDGRAQETGDIKGIEKRRRLNQREAEALAIKRRANRQKKLDALVMRFPWAFTAADGTKARRRRSRIQERPSPRDLRLA